MLLDDEEYREIRDAARRQRMPVAEWVRQALRRARAHRRGTVEAKLRAIANATRHDFPTADIEDMLDEIAAGRRLARGAGTNRILSFDRGFDPVPGVERLA